MSLSFRLLTLLATALTCGAAAAQDVVGKMGEVELRASEVRTILDSLSPEARRQLAADPQQLERAVRDQLIIKAVLAEARHKGWDKRPELQPMIERAREQVIVSSYVSNVARPPEGYPSEEELKQFYEQNKAQLQAPPQYQLAQIYLPAPDAMEKPKADEVARKAADLGARLAKAPADFARLAKENSAHRESADKGGEIGWVGEDQMVMEIRRVAVRMKKGEISPPIKSQAGWHIIRMMDIRPAAQRPLAEVRGRLVAAMRQRKTQEGEKTYIDALSAKSRPTINQIELSKIQESLK
jgi:peptidylprolyl isomerase